ncbi:E3 ubiquitin-protein ligase TRIM36-like [Ostrea edulis]|uniref:E3 ubiquitin-protein ligase TRIM36-like n=1 Tax=Ostrea edulis TaxID=37623 RepID=UPI002094D854|nr:E3 ubiquitin-protein ligase TRIM36-like [Ostrea edulis]
MLHPRRSAQDVLQCDLCKTVPQSRCEPCNVDLCNACVGKHISDLSKIHNVMSSLQRKSTPSYPKCPKHANKHSELYCEKCDIPVCSTCASEKHRGHNLCEVLENISSNLEELETRIYPRYEKMVSDLQTEKDELQTNYGKLITATDQQGEVLHREITAIVDQRKSDIEKIKNKHRAVLDKNTDEITNRITELKKIIEDLKKILNTKDASLISTYKSKNGEFRQLPPKVQVTSPSFSPSKIDKDHLNKMFGSMSSLSIITEKQGYTSKSPEAISFPPVKPLLDEPRLTASIDTGYGCRLRSVSCLSENKVWTCGDNKIMKLLNLQGTQLTSIQTESGDTPEDITVTQDGDLVYTDYNNKTVNLVKNKQIQTVITLQGWIPDILLKWIPFRRQRWTPRYVCNTSSGDLLVTMISDDRKQSKVVRYSGAKEKQTIQFDEQGQPLFSSGGYKYINENRNLDICVADIAAKAVVVVNQSGKLRFRYTGHYSNTKKSFTPVGITSDSQSHILTADWYNDCIHILDQDGQFLRYIQNCQLRRPLGLCVDIRDNLLVAEDTGYLKKIQYL